MSEEQASLSFEEEVDISDWETDNVVTLDTAHLTNAWTLMTPWFVILTLIN